MKKSALILSVTLLAGTLLTACGGGGAGTTGGAEKTDRETLTVAVSADATSLDPISYNDIYSENVMKQIYNKLMEQDEEGELVPGLAESIEQPDPQTFVVHLREGIQFSNGNPLTAEDVVYSLTRLTTSPKYAYIYDKIDTDSFETPDDYTVSFRLKSPDGSFLMALSHPAASIVDKETVEAAGDGYAKAPVGTGPFKLESWKELDNITLTKNDTYYGDAPAFNKMVLKVIAEPNNRLIELESGQVDVAYEIAPNDIAKVEENDALTLYRKLDNSVHFLGMNVENGPFANPKAREALSHAMNLQEMVDSVYMGVGKVATSTVNPNFPYSIADTMKAPEYNAEEAKKLFEEAGVAPGTTFKIYTNDNQQRQDMATILQAKLQEIGYDATITTLEWGAYVEALSHKEHDIFFMSWSPSVVDPHYALYGPFHSKNKGVGPNYMFYGNPTLDELLDRGIAMENGPARQGVYKDAQELLGKELPWIPVAYGEQVFAAQKYVKNLTPSASSSQTLYKITFE